MSCGTAAGMPTTMFITQRTVPENYEMSYLLFLIKNIILNANGYFKRKIPSRETGIKSF
jgi:hypothetical protein